MYKSISHYVYIFYTSITLNKLKKVLIIHSLTDSSQPSHNLDMDQRLVTLSLANQGQSAISKYYKKNMFNL